jgi:23S rRNA (uracil1939-C5)-methyltransferase
VTAIADDAARVASARASAADVVVLDPPRAGAREVCAVLGRRPPRRCVYVSCDPPTLGRDLGLLGTGMDLASLTAFEMFPQTPHVEVVAVLHKRSARA